MSDWFGGIGIAAEGGLLSRALEPDSGAKPPHPDQPERCHNCASPLVGAYCHACGQRGHLHRTIGAFLHDLLHGALHFEGKLFRTLPMLIFRPGKLTRRYIDGERARFVSPMALFLFGVFLMFAIFQVIGLTTPTGLRSPDMEAAMERMDTRLAAEQAEAERRLAELDDAATPEDRAAAEEQVALAEEAIAGLEAAGSFDMSDGQTNEIGITGFGGLDTKLQQKWNEDPDLMVYKLQANAYKFSWLLIPISIPFVWLLFFWKRRFPAYDHAIFVTYSLSFMTLFFITLSVLNAAGIAMDYLIFPLLAIPPLHLYKQLRHAYGLSRWSTIWRQLVLSIFIWIVLLLFLWVLAILGAF